MRGVVADGRVALCHTRGCGRCRSRAAVYDERGAAMVETADVLYPAALAIVTYVVARLISLFA
jgi:hypothetical protein